MISSARVQELLCGGAGGALCVCVCLCGGQQLWEKNGCPSAVRSWPRSQGHAAAARRSLLGNISSRVPPERVR